MNDWRLKQIFFYIPTLLTNVFILGIILLRWNKKILSTEFFFFRIVEEATPTTKKKGFLCFFDRVVLGIGGFYVLIFRKKWEVRLIKDPSLLFPSNED